MFRLAAIAPRRCATCNAAAALLALYGSLAQAQALQLTADIPACRSFPGSPLPEKYMKLAKANKGVAWLAALKADDNHLSGEGPGYRIMAWDADRRNLRLLDKWEADSRAAGVYAFFKQHGARRPVNHAERPDDSRERFDPETEKYELMQACESTQAPGTRSAQDGAWSRHLLARCKAGER